MGRILTAIFFVVTALILGASTSNFGQEQKTFTRTKRSENIPSCFETLATCKRNNSCLSAYRSIKKKCTISFGKCTADNQDLPKCPDYIATLQAAAFSTDPRCDCINFDQTKKIVKCFGLYNMVYFNPCYDEGMEMQNKKILDAAIKDLNATSSTLPLLLNTTPTSVFQQTTSADSNEDITTPVVKSKNKLENDQISEKELRDLDELLAGEEARRPRRPSIPWKNPNQGKIITTTSTSTSLPFTSATPTTTESMDTETLTKSTEISHLHLNKAFVLSSIEIALIALAALVCLSIFVGVFFYVKRKRNSVRYTGAKGTNNTASLITYTEDKQKLSGDTFIS